MTKKEKSKPRLVKETCVAGRVIDVAIKIKSGHVEGYKREPKKNKTPESVAKNNDRVAATNLTRRINANFGAGDGHLVLTFAEEPTHEVAEHCRKLFMRRLKRLCAKKGLTLKAVWATELERRLHIHMVINYVDIEDIGKCWTWGRFKLIPLTEEGDGNYQKLAEYIIKETSKNFRKPENQTKQRYNCTRNLIKPIIVRQPARPRDFNRDNIKALSGYVLNEDSITEFTNPVTGTPTLIYNMTSITEEPRLTKWRSGKNARIVKQESLATFEKLRQVEFSDLYEWDYL